MLTDSQQASLWRAAKEWSAFGQKVFAKEAKKEYAPESPRSLSGKRSVRRRGRSALIETRRAAERTGSRTGSHSCGSTQPRSKAAVHHPTPRAYLSLSLGDEVPHIFIRESHQRPRKNFDHGGNDFCNKICQQRTHAVQRRGTRSPRDGMIASQRHR
jgi:hypothetical protein